MHTTNVDAIASYRCMRKKTNLVFLFLFIAGTLSAQKPYDNVVGLKTEGGRGKVFPGIFCEREVGQSMFQFTVSFVPKFVQEDAAYYLLGRLPGGIYTNDSGVYHSYYQENLKSRMKSLFRFEFQYAYFAGHKNQPGRNKGLFFGAAATAWPMKQQQSADYYEWYSSGTTGYHLDSTYTITSVNAGLLAGYRVLAGDKMTIDFQIDFPFYAALPARKARSFVESPFGQTKVEGAISLGFRF